MNKILKFFQKRNQIKIEKLENCEEVDRMVGRYDGIVTQDRFESNLRLNGNLTIKKDIHGPIEIQLSLTRCGFDRSNCEDYDKIIFKNICEKIRDRKSIFAQLDYITPRITCPFKSVCSRKIICYSFHMNMYFSREFTV